MTLHNTANVQPKYSLWYLLHLANRGICFPIWRRTSGVHLRFTIAKSALRKRSLIQNGMYCWYAFKSFWIWELQSPPYRRECQRLRVLETLASRSEGRYSRGRGLARCIPVARARDARRAGGIQPASLTSCRSPRSCVRTSPVRDVRSLRTLPVLTLARRALGAIFH